MLCVYTQTIVDVRREVWVFLSNVFDRSHLAYGSPSLMLLQLADIIGDYSIHNNLTIVNHNLYLASFYCGCITTHLSVNVALQFPGELRFQLRDLSYVNVL